MTCLPYHDSWLQEYYSRYFSALHHASHLHQLRQDSNVPSLLIFCVVLAKYGLNFQGSVSEFRIVDAKFISLLLTKCVI